VGSISSSLVGSRTAMNTVLTIIYGISIVLALLFNTILLRAQYVLRRQLRTTTSIYIASLSLSELVFAILFLVAFVENGFLDYASTWQRQNQFVFSCSVTPYFELFCLSFNVFCMVAISVDVFQAVVAPNSVTALNVGGQSSAAPTWQSRRRRAIVGLVVVSSLSAIYSLRILAQNFSGADPVGEATQRESSTTSWTAAATVGNVTCFSGECDVTSQPNNADSATSGTNDIRDLCDFLVSDDVQGLAPRLFDFLLLFVIPTAIQVVLYVSVARKLWSTEVTKIVQIVL
jgi:accessory gene regulator protein AgrB